MPQQFTYKDTETGRTVTFNQDTEPTEQEIAARFDAEQAPVAAAQTAAPARPSAPAKILSDDEILEGAKRLRELGKESAEIEGFIAQARKEQREQDARDIDNADLSKIGMVADTAEYVAKATAKAAAEGAMIGAAASIGQREGARLPGMLKLPGIMGGGALSGMAADYAIQAAQSVGEGRPFRYDVPRGLGTGVMAAVPGLPAIASVSPAMQAARQNVPALTRTLEFFLSRHPAEVAKNVMGAVTGGQVEKAARGEGPLSLGEMGLATAAGYAGGRMGVAALTSRARTTVQDQMANDSVANVRRREWMENGGLVNPVTSNRESLANKALKTVAGTQADDAIAIKNQNITDKLAREDMRFPRAPDGSQLPLSDANYRMYLDQLGGPLRRIESLGGAFPGLVDSYQLARDDARNAWAAWRAAKNNPQGKGTAQQLADAERLQQVADAAGNAIDTALTGANQSALGREWRNANRLFAKTYNNWAATLDGRIDASILGDIHGEGQVKRLNGYQKLIAEMAQGDEPVMRHPSVIKGERFNVSPQAASFAAAVAGLQGGLLGISKGMGPMAAGATGGLALGAVAGGYGGPLAARALLSSPFYQQTMGFATPFYSRPAFGPGAARLGTEFMMTSPSMAPASSLLQFQ